MTIDLGIEISCHGTSFLNMELVPEMAKQGLILLNHKFQNGRLEANIANVGRNIVVIQDGQPLVELWSGNLGKLEWENED